MYFINSYNLNSVQKPAQKSAPAYCDVFLGK